MKKRILMVDDDPVLTKVLRRVMDMEPEWEFFSAPDAVEALRIIEEVRPDVMVLDCDLGPGKQTGLEFMRDLRRHPDHRSLPILLFTGVMVDLVDRATGLDLGADGYVLKPVSPPILLAKASAAIRRAAAK